MTECAALAAELRHRDVVHANRREVRVADSAGRAASRRPRRPSSAPPSRP